MLPSLIPVTFGELRAYAVYRFLGSVYRVVAWSYSDDVSEFLVKRDVRVVEVSLMYFTEEP
jgi:hypothetical protein